MKLKRNLLMTLGLLALGAAIVGGATFSEFSSDATVQNNSFKAGTLHMELSKDAGDQTLAWKTPENWSPGQSVTRTIHFTNTGNVDANHIYLGFKDVVHQGEANGANFLNNIIVTNLSENFNGHVTANQAVNIEKQVGNGDGVLTLNELVSFYQNGYGYYTFDDQSGDGVVLAGGNQNDYSLSITFQFDPNAGNDLQGAQAGFTLMANATQNSTTDGLAKLHK